MRCAWASFVAGAVFFVVSADCGGKIAQTTGVDDSGWIDSLDGLDARSDTGFGIDPGGDASALPLVDSGLFVDGGAKGCLARPAVDCVCAGEDCPPPAETALKNVVRECLQSSFACGVLSVSFDANGCATAMRMDHPEGSAGFVACMSRRLDGLRWCTQSQDVTISIGSCTVR